LKEDRFDRVFIALHGRGGEDGTMQGALEQMGLPYTGSGVMGSAIAMDKTRTKWLWQSQDLPTPKFVEISDEQDLKLAAMNVGFPMMIKPVNEGSSVGALKVMNELMLNEAWKEALKYDSRVMSEEWIEGDEYTVSIINNQALPVIKLVTPRVFYDYEAKYIENTTEYLCPCGLDDSEEQVLKELALKAFDATGASGWGRVDLFIDDNENPALLEVNTIPGLTDHSLVPMAAKAVGISFDELILQILETSMVDSEYRNEVFA
jgi:D-alanine-D-alanine ligase